MKMIPGPVSALSRKITNRVSYAHAHPCSEKEREGGDFGYNDTLLILAAVNRSEKGEDRDNYTCDL